ncbi:MAG: antitermination protein NusG [Candidatus Nealsonbacteria bacterium]|nr:antitermination protein NusG [Candidatus Nealsonbacteria bacterium]
MPIADRDTFVSGAEPTIYPNDLFDVARDGRPDHRWWVLHTKSRQEKAIARELREWRAPYYLPLVEKTTVYPRRRVTSYIPLLRSYIFLYGSEDDRNRGLKTNRVVQILAVPDQDEIREDLHRLYRLIASGAPLTVESRFRPGHCVRIRRGPFAGLEGTVMKRRDETRLIVSVNFLQQGASVEIEDFMLEPIDTACYVSKGNIEDRHGSLCLEGQH